MKKIIFLFSLINLLMVNSAELDRKKQDTICEITANGLVGDVAVFLSENPAYIKAKNRSGAGLMHIAASAGNDKLTKFLVSKGLNYKGIDFAGNSLLHYANEKIIAKCLTAKIDINCTNFQGKTPLHLACEQADSKRKVTALIVEKLIKNKANIDALDNSSETPLSLAIKHNKPEIITLLLANNADPALPNSRGETPIEFLRRSPACGCLEGLFQSPPVAHFKPWRQAKEEEELAQKSLEQKEQADRYAIVCQMMQDMRQEPAQKERRNSF